MSSEERLPHSAAPEEPEQDFGEMLSRLLDTVRRRKWYVLIPIPLVVIATVVVALYLPSKYQSEALVGIVAPKVSTKYVASDATPLADTVVALQRQILSRISLTKIAEEMNIYEDDSPPAEQAERLQAELEVTPIFRGPYEIISALHISFTSARPETAQRVVSRVVALFMDENLQTREDQVVTTKSFLGEQVKVAREKLSQQEARLEAFKSRYSGQLPEQQPINMQILSDLRSRLQATSVDLDRTRRVRRELEAEAEGRLRRLQAERTELLKRYTPQYAEVKKKDSEIAQHTALLAQDSTAASTGIENLELRQMKVRLDQNAHELEDLGREEETLRTEIREYQQRVNSVPVRELELSGLERDHDLLKKDYESLKAKEMESGLNANLEVTQRGEQFRLIEPPALPLKPVGPNRLRMGAIGLVGGLFLGLVLAFVRDLLDPSFQSEWAVKAVVDVPLVIGIPKMLTPTEQTRRRHSSVFAWLGGTALMLLAVGAELYLVVQELTRTVRQ